MQPTLHIFMDSTSFFCICLVTWHSYICNIQSSPVTNIQGNEFLCSSTRQDYNPKSRLSGNFCQMKQVSCQDGCAYDDGQLEQWRTFHTSQIQQFECKRFLCTGLISVRMTNGPFTDVNQMTHVPPKLKAIPWLRLKANVAADKQQWAVHNWPSANQSFQDHSKYCVIMCSEYTQSNLYSDFCYN